MADPLHQPLINRHSDTSDGVGKVVVTLSTTTTTTITITTTYFGAFWRQKATASADGPRAPSRFHIVVGGALDVEMRHDGPFPELDCLYAVDASFRAQGAD